MNGPRDFGSLRCSQNKKMHIALMVGLWNNADESGDVIKGPDRPIGFRLQGHEASRRFSRRLKYAADKLGLRVR